MRQVDFFADDWGSGMFCFVSDHTPRTCSFRWCSIPTLTLLRLHADPPPALNPTGSGIQAQGNLNSTQLAQGRARRPAAVELSPHAMRSPSGWDAESAFASLPDESLLDVDGIQMYHLQDDVQTYHVQYVQVDPEADEDDEGQQAPPYPHRHRSSAGSAVHQRHPFPHSLSSLQILTPPASPAHVRVTIPPLCGMRGRRGLCSAISRRCVLPLCSSVVSRLADVAAFRSMRTFFCQALRAR